MKIFISWSEERSKAVASALHGWLPLVLNYASPWLSDKDIGAGNRWAQLIASELENANFGIICITPENLQSEWILFEAGALSKSMQDAKVIPLLYGLDLSDLSGPLSQFQAQKTELEGITEIVRSINNIAESGISDEIISQTVPALWPKLEKEFEAIPEMRSGEKHVRPQSEILEELVSGVRGLNSRISRIDPEMSEQGSHYRKKRLRRIHPMMFDELVSISRDIDDAPTSLLLMAGYLKDDFPLTFPLCVGPV